MKVRKRVYASGRTKWRLDLGKNDRGKRILLSFDSEAAAKAELVRRKKAREQRGSAVSWFSDAELLELRLAREALEAVGSSIGEAVAAWLLQARPPVARVSLPDLIERCLVAKWEENKRPRYLSQLKCSALSFARWMAVAADGTDRPDEAYADAITAADVEGWLRSQGWAPKTRKVYLTDLRTIFAWGLEAGHVRENPCAGIRPPALEASEVTTLSPAAVARLLVRAWRVPARGGEDFSDLLPYVVIGFFCGLRPERELGELTWDRINLEEGTIVVAGRSAKSRGRRVVDLAPNALAWLRSWAERRRLGEGETGRREGEKIVGKNFVRRWRRLRKACGFGTAARPWPHDVMRHTYASYHYAWHRNEHLLKAQLGHHQGSEMLFQHYRAVRSAREAERFWGLGPPD